MELSIPGATKGVRASLAVGEIDLVHGDDVTAASGELHMPMSLYSPKQHGDVGLKVYVVSVCFKCFRCFRGMLQMFYMDVAKVDRDIAYLQWLYTYVASVCSQCFICFSDVYCKCVYPDIVYASHICCKCFIRCCVCL